MMFESSGSIEEKRKEAHLGIHFIDAAHGFFDTAAFDGLADLYALLNRFVVHLRVQTSLRRELDGGIPISFQDEVVEYESVEIPVLSASVQRK
jgi:hypothetical protein